jgi:hypothetical protein
VGEESWVGKRGQAALSGSKPKAPGSAGGHLLSFKVCVSCSGDGYPILKSMRS